MGTEEERRRRRVAVAGRVLGGFALILSALTPALGHADSFPPDVVGVLAGEGKAATELTFVGRSGQLYFADGETWKRQCVGGIASDVLGAVRSGKVVFAVARRAPLFRNSSAGWRATPLGNRGSASYAADGAVVMASLGRHLYQLDGGSWKRFATAARRVTAMYAATKGRVYVATTRGRLRRFDGKRATVIKNALPANDYVIRLLGRPGSALFGLSKTGTVLTVGASQATSIGFEGPLAGFEVHALGYGPKKAILAAGTIPADDGSASPVLARLDKAGATLLETLEPLNAADRITVVHTAADGRLVVATFGGMVRIRATDGSWEVRQVSGEVPSLASATAPSHRPARTR
mgnify:FL=1